VTLVKEKGTKYFNRLGIVHCCFQSERQYRLCGDYLIAMRTQWKFIAIGTRANAHQTQAGAASRLWSAFCKALIFSPMAEGHSLACPTTRRMPPLRAQPFHIASIGSSILIEHDLFGNRFPLFRVML
jgi:hypothetical protein